jgi:hypothetical protein
MINDSMKIMDFMTNRLDETPQERAERLEEARREDLEYLEECREDRSFEEQEKFDSGTKESDFL